MDEIAKEYDVIVLGTGMSMSFAFPTPQCGVRSRCASPEAIAAASRAALDLLGVVSRN